MGNFRFALFCFFLYWGEGISETEKLHSINICDFWRRYFNILPLSHFHNFLIKIENRTITLMNDGHTRNIPWPVKFVII